MNGNRWGPLEFSFSNILIFNHVEVCLFKYTHTHTQNPNKLMLIINKFSKVRGYKFKIQKSVFSTLTMRNLKMNVREKPH